MNSPNYRFWPVQPLSLLLGWLPTKFDKNFAFENLFDQLLSYNFCKMPLFCSNCDLDGALYAKASVSVSLANFLFWMLILLNVIKKSSRNLFIFFDLSECCQNFCIIKIRIFVLEIMLIFWLARARCQHKRLWFYLHEHHRAHSNTTCIL